MYNIIFLPCISLKESYGIYLPYLLNQERGMFFILKPRFFIQGKYCSKIFTTQGQNIRMKDVKRCSNKITGNNSMEISFDKIILIYQVQCTYIVHIYCKKFYRFEVVQFINFLQLVKCFMLYKRTFCYLSRLFREC